MQEQIFELFHKMIYAEQDLSFLFIDFYLKIFSKQYIYCNIQGLQFMGCVKVNG